jgi:hypothetical protein
MQKASATFGAIFAFAVQMIVPKPAKAKTMSDAQNARRGQSFSFFDNNDPLCCADPALQMTSAGAHDRQQQQRQQCC